MMPLFKSFYAADSFNPYKRADDAVTNSGDWMLAVGPICMTFFGLVMVYSASLFVASSRGAADSYYLFRQMLVALASLGALAVGMTVEPSLYRKYARHLIIIAIILMTIQTIFMPAVKGAKRWFILPGGIMFQTSEFVRMAVIIYVARLVSDDATIGLTLNKRLLKALVPVLILAAITYFQRDLSAAAMVAAIAGLILFLAGMRPKQFWALTISCAAVAFAFALRTKYQRDRILEFLFPGGSLTAAGYQAYQSIIGFGCGGVTGAGLGQGKQKMLFLPEPHTDFIYSIIGEELGLLGASAVLFAFIFLFLRAISVVKRQSDRFNFLFGGGLIASLLMFALVHMAVTTGLTPVTGLPLPFISNGGSSLLISLWSMGVLWNLSRRTSTFD